jgi:hypothetical protein
MVLRAAMYSRELGKNVELKNTLSASTFIISAFPTTQLIE